MADQTLLDELSRLRAVVSDLEAQLQSRRATDGSGSRSHLGGEPLSRFIAFAVESMSDGVFLMAKDASIEYVNKAGCTQLGHTEQELLQLTIFDINPTLTQESWDSIWDVTVNDKVQVIETLHRAKDGRVFPIEVLANFIELDGQQYSCSFTREISDRKEMEARIRQAEKMEAIGQLAGGVAHDFNNQLSGIMGYANLLKIELVDNPDLAEYVENIMTATRRSAGLTAQLLAFSRQGKYLSVPVDAHALIDEAVHILSRSIDKNIAIGKTFDAPSAAITGDPAQLENALLNLAINARDAMPAGGEMTFATRIVELDESFCSEYSFEIRPGPYLQIRVVDTGTGMSTEVKRRIFEPFFTTKEPGKGTGMGLASVYGTVKNHKGAIDVQSTPGAGTEFVLYFPVSGANEPHRADGGNLQTPERLSARVLLIDDEILVLGATRKMLEQLGCDVETANTGAEAIAVCETSHDAFDAIILDLIMPGMNGKETFRRLRKINPRAAVIVASGYSLEGEVQELLDEGAQAFLKKPFDAEELAAALAKVEVSRNPSPTILG
jgi:PAS domain S-box-containing protein